jgi:hypothetical protein
LAASLTAASDSYIVAVALGSAIIIGVDTLAARK